MVGDPEPCTINDHTLTAREVFDGDAPYVDNVSGLVGYYVPASRDPNRELAGTVGRVPSKVDELRLVIAPGMLQLRVVEHSDPNDDDDGLDGELVGEGLDDDPQGEEEGPDQRRITEFSRRSKAAMRRRILSIPWGDYMRPGDMIHVVTLTAPGEDFRRHLGDRHQAGRALKRLADRLSYAIEGTRDRGPARAAWEAGGREGPFIFGARYFWKLEFQRREAPHWHLVIIAPAELDGMPFREWLADAWYKAVGSGQDSHRRAGTRVDVQASIEASDVQRLALYFSGYSTVKDKGYQHVVPEWWYDDNGSAGRFWGSVGLDSYSVEVDLHTTMATHIKRLFRARQRSQRGHVKVADMPEAKYRKWRGLGRIPTLDWRFKTPLTKKRTVYRLKPGARRLDRTGPNPEHGPDQVVRRTVRRRLRTSSFTGLGAGCTVFANDGPTLAVDLARHLADIDNDIPDGAEQYVRQARAPGAQLP
ncbi:MAG: hypothetical protein AAGA93_00560 [Actinomycetota bacterium]